MRKTAVILIALMLAAMPGTAPAARYRVRAIAGNEWDPSFRHITPGNVIVWKNPTNRTHDVKAYGGNWTYYEIIRPGERTTKRFRREGAFKYRCRLHSTVRNGQCDGMCGVIHVQR
ncbi:MAG: hypothetical protein ABR575_04005 [Actinomycetota bacterium]